MSLTENKNNGQKETLGIEFIITEDGDLVVQNGTTDSLKKLVKEARERKNYCNSLGRDKVDALECSRGNNVEFMEHYTVSSYVDDPITGNRTVVQLEFSDMSVVCDYSLEEKLRYIRCFVEGILNNNFSIMLEKCKTCLDGGICCFEKTKMVSTHRSKALNFRVEMDNKDDYSHCRVVIMFDTDIDRSKAVYCESKGCFCDKYVREAKDRIKFTYNLKEMKMVHLFASLHKETLDCLKNEYNF